MKKNLSIILALLLLGLTSCKDEWLDAKPSKSIVDASTLADFQAIVDDTRLFNESYPGLGELSSDDYYVPFSLWQSSSSNLQRNSYIWNDDIYAGETSNAEWKSGFGRILVLNMVLEGIDKIEKTQEKSITSRHVKGSALLFRSLSFYSLAQIFCGYYSIKLNFATEELGLPLKLNSNVNESVSRSTLNETYNQIISDLLLASELLPEVSSFKTRPSKGAAYGLLARIYLSIGDFENARKYADLSIGSNGILLDYNKLSVSVNYPIPLMNEEVIFHFLISANSFTRAPAFNVDTNLYKMYQEGDLRKGLYYFNQGKDIKFKGGYNGNSDLFGGIALDEMYLIRAESQARLGNPALALDDLNALIKNRWKSEKFIPYIDGTVQDVLKLILNERRKELVYRGLRWSDLKRLNNDPDVEPITLSRRLGENTYNLEPNSLKYAMPIPPDEIKLSGIKQNPR